MAPKAEEILRKRKESQQKKILFLLVPVLGILLVIQGPKLLKTVSGGSEPTKTVAAEEAPAGTAAPAPAAGTTTSLPEGSSGAAPAATGTTTPAAGAIGTALVSLTDTELPPQASEGHLVSFDRFVARDPFRQLVVAPKTETSGDGAAGSTAGSGDATGDASSGAGATVSGLAAVLRINGVEENVSKEGVFPKDDPTFRLVSIEEKAVQIGLVSGAFSSGGDSIALDLGESIILVSQPDGVRYTIELVKFDSAEEEPAA